MSFLSERHVAPTPWRSQANSPNVATWHTSGPHSSGRVGIDSSICTPDTTAVILLVAWYAYAFNVAAHIHIHIHAHAEIQQPT